MTRRVQPARPEQHAVTARLTSGGPANSFGRLLDDVVLTAGTLVATLLPEPSSLAPVAGLGLVGSIARRRRPG